MLVSISRIRRDTPGFLLDCTRRWGDVVAFPIPRRPVLLVNDPAGVKRILQDNHRGYDKATVQYRSLAAVTGGGLLTSDGDTWRRHRRLAAPAFHHSTVAAVGDHTAAAAARLSDRWDGIAGPLAGSVVDVDAAMMQTTLDVVGRALFGTDLDEAVDTQALVGAVLDALGVVVARARWPLPTPDRLPTPRTRTLRRSLTTIDAAVHDVLAARARRGPVPGGRADLLDLLMAVSADGVALSECQLRDELVTLVIAGHETVASALTWTWYLLGRDPAATSRLHTEVDAVLGGAAGPRWPGVDDLAALPWARAVVEEALRLYPPAWVVTRRAARPDRVAGHDVPAGALVIMSPWTLHRHPSVWPDPERFDPSRFLPDSRSEGARTAYVPFGAGPRLCIGREFALTEATLLLAGLAARWSVQPVTGARVEADASVTVRPRGGLPMRLSRRQPVPATDGRE